MFASRADSLEVYPRRLGRPRKECFLVVFQIFFYNSVKAIESWLLSLHIITANYMSEPIIVYVYHF